MFGVGSGERDSLGGENEQLSEIIHKINELVK